jgi:hypothetical protein
MQRFPFYFPITIFIFVTIALVACSEEKAGEWEPIPDDDQSSGDDDTGGNGCAVSEAQWQVVLDKCSMQIPLPSSGTSWTASALYEDCNACLVGCYQQFPTCSTDFNQCMAVCHP